MGNNDNNVIGSPSARFTGGKLMPFGSISTEKDVQQAGTFRSAGHIAGYTGHISRVNPDATSIETSGRQKKWNKDLLVQNHKTKMSGYAGCRK